MRRVMRWKGRIRKDLRESRWQTGSLSSFSRTSRKLLLVFLRGQRAAGRRGEARTGGHSEGVGSGHAVDGLWDPVGREPRCDAEAT